MKNKYIIFDLDDTLIYEIDYLKSAYLEISQTLEKQSYDSLFSDIFSMYQKRENVFEFLVSKYPAFTKEKFLEMYRSHLPKIHLDNEVKNILQQCKVNGYKLGLITDGRSITQRNKLKALEIENVFDLIIVSEEFGSTKPDERNFKVFMENYIDEYIYIADNPQKDFVTPNKLGWKSICLLDKGQNIHSQSFDVPKDFLPQLKIKSISELLKHL